MPSVQEVTDQSFKQFVEGETPVLIDFWAAWCGPCKMLSPVVEDLASELGPRLKAGKLDVDDNPQTAREFGIMSIPTLLVFKGGKVVRQIVGYMPKKQLYDKLADLLPQG